MNVPAKSEKKLRRSKTIVVNAITAATLIIPVLTPLPPFVQYTLYGGAVVSLLNISLRFIGDNPVEVPREITVDHDGVKEGPIA